MSFKKWAIVAVCLFGIGMVLGLTVPVSIADFLAEDLAALEELAASLSPFKVSTAVFIFIKNVSALMFSFIFSPFLCLLPIMALMVNGWLLSFISAMVVRERSLGLVLAALLPHGIIEIPALIIGEAAALSFGAMVVMLLVRKESRTVLISIFSQSFRQTLLILVLLFITGIFPTVIVLALLREQTRAIFLSNLKQNARYLMIACILLVPAAIIETYITPLFLT
ncbi:stage II sporulation protein M [Chloroflexota bacterium]